MQKNEFIFVYGTLRRGERADLARQRHSFGVDYIGVDHINGCLYHLGAYPGVKAITRTYDPTDPVVTGEVFRIRETSITALLDAYEGYNSDDPERGLYNASRLIPPRGERPGSTSTTAR
jgi:gamma-glutamylcyclotransferase (GGCT)/AIG2-like uncharacterized protein YtfP